MREFKAGDLLTFTGSGWISRSIRYWTLGPSHVGIVCPNDSGELVLVESTSLCQRPCLVRGEVVSGCQVHYPEERISDYNGNFETLRLTESWQLDWKERALLTSRLIDGFVRRGVGYDYGGAMISGTRVLKLSKFWTADLDQLFCSELVAAVLMRLNRLRLANPTRFNPGSLCRSVLRCGTYERVEK